MAAHAVSEVICKESKSATSHLLASPQELLSLRRGYLVATQNGVCSASHSREHKFGPCTAGRSGMLAALAYLAQSLLRRLGVKSIAKEVRDLRQENHPVLMQVPV